MAERKELTPDDPLFKHKFFLECAERWGEQELQKAIKDICAQANDPSLRRVGSPRWHTYSKEKENELVKIDYIAEPWLTSEMYRFYTELYCEDLFYCQTGEYRMEYPGLKIFHSSDLDDLFKQIKSYKYTDFSPALERFIESDEFAESLTAATKASWGGGGYSVELFEDGSFRVLWDNHIGNLYESPGIILGLPTFDDDDYNDRVNSEHDPISESEYFYDCYLHEKEEIANKLRDTVAQVYNRRRQASMKNEF